MRRRILIVATLTAALTATSAGAVDDATWTYEGGDALVANEPGTVTVTLQVADAQFDPDLPIGYRHFVLRVEEDGSTTPVSDLDVPWTRGEDDGTATTDGDGGLVLPTIPFTRADSPALTTATGDVHTIDLTLPAGDHVVFSDLVDLTPPTSRLAGASRYETAAAASRRHFAPNVDVAYVASGEVFPDALAAGPAAAHREAPLLLTAREALPAATRAELRRLAPRRVIVVGGDAAISGDVERELAPYAGTVERIAGIDRYDTAARIAREAWGSTTVDAAYIASGEAFPDALGASARAALDDVPILLVQRDAVPTSTGVTLDVLGVDMVTVAGGGTVVSALTYDALRQRVGSAVRRFGADRYATSAALVDGSRTGARLLIATGETFPDGLTAGSLARRLDADLLLTRPDEVPEVIADRAEALAPRRVVGFGGLTALTAAVLEAFDDLRTPLTPLFLDPVVEPFGTLPLDVAEAP